MTEFLLAPGNAPFLAAAAFVALMALAEALLAAGFYSSPSGIRFRN